MISTTVYLVCLAFALPVIVRGRGTQPLYCIAFLASLAWGIWGF